MFKQLNQYIDFSSKINDYISTIMVDNAISCEEYHYSYIWALVKSQGVAIRGFNFKKLASEHISSMLFQDNLETTIAFNKNLDNKDKNFTVSYEIVHYLFHKTENNAIFIDTQKNIHESNHKDLYEFQANIGASVILIPDCVLIHFLNKGWNLGQMSNHFGISENKLYVRLIQMMQVNLGLSTIVAKDIAGAIQYKYYGRGKNIALLLAYELEHQQTVNESIEIF